MNTDPYKVLGVSAGCTEGEIRRRYLDLVRLYSPERDPHRFAEVREAYEMLRDPTERMKAWLFPERNNDSLEAIAADAQQQVCDQRIPVEILLSLAERI